MNPLAEIKANNAFVAAHSGIHDAAHVCTHRSVEPPDGFLNNHRGCKSCDSKWQRYARRVVRLFETSVGVPELTASQRSFIENVIAVNRAAVEQFIRQLAELRRERERISTDEALDAVARMNLFHSAEVRRAELLTKIITGFQQVQTEVQSILTAQQRAAAQHTFRAWKAKLLERCVV